MTSAYFCPLVTLPTIIDGPGEYVTRIGDLVVIDRATSKHEFGCVGSYKDMGVGERWHRSGRIYANVETANDVVRRV